MNRTSRLPFLGLLTVLSLVVSSAGAGEVKVFSLQSQEALLKGDLDGVAIDPLGTLTLAGRVARLAEVAEPYLFTGAVHPEGFVLGTGSRGRVLLVERDGDVRELFSTEEPEVYALWVDPDGTVFAGSSPQGRIYRLDRGAEEAVVHSQLEATYIWALARDGDGNLLAATGTEGRLWEISEEGEARLRYDAEEPHLRSLEVLSDGRLLMGTAGEGLVLELSADGSVRALYDASGPEIVDFAIGDDGEVYVAALASESSFVDLAKVSARSGNGNGNGGDEENGNGNGATAGASVSVTVQEGPASVGSRPGGFQGARSEILRLSEAGGVETLWSFDKQTVFDLLWHRGRLWVATGLDGQLYSWQGDRMVLEKEVDEKQIVTLLADDPGPALLTTNAAMVYRFEEGSERSGSYTSDALDAGQVARFGTLRWRGELPRGTAVSWRVRSGMSASPDATWSEWAESLSGGEIAIDTLPTGRYVQFRADLQGSDGTSPSITDVELTYLQLNGTPRIEELSVLDPGQILVPANFNPASQAYEPASPNRDGIFTTLDPTGDKGNGPTKQLWKKGYRSLRWKASDPNEDELRYRLSFRPSGSDGDWLAVAEDLEETYYSFDATVLPDGRYRFRLEASDADSNPAGEGKVADRISDIVVIDHRAPRVTRSERSGSTLVVSIADELSPLRHAEISIDAGPWRGVAAADGLLDSRGEQLEIELPDSARLVLLRLTDAAYNIATFDLTEALD